MFIQWIMPDQAFLDRLCKGTMQSNMDQLDRAGILPLAGVGRAGECVPEQ